jgi:hypothetical protein
MAGVKEVCKEEADELERDGDEHVPEEREEGTTWERVYDHVTD